MFKKGEKKVCNFLLPILFAPNGNRPLTESYPELNEVPVFKEISSRELKFVWYYTILYNNVTPEKDRIQMAISESYGVIISEEDKQRLINGNWSSKLHEAIDKMSSYDLSPRLKSKLMIEQIFQEYQTILKEGRASTEMEEKQKFTALSKTIMENLPMIVKSLETSLGVSEIEIPFYENNNNLTDGFYKAKKEQSQ
jgi:hypothetical protein